jgi:hypothetical protein
MDSKLVWLWALPALYGNEFSDWKLMLNPFAKSLLKN